MSYPGYVQTTTTPKWTKNDCDAITDAVLAGTVGSKTIAYPYSYLIRNTAGVYDAINATGDRAYGGPDDEGGVDGTDISAVTAACLTAINADGGGTLLQGPGLYTYSDIVDLAGLSNIRWLGMGAGATRIKIADGFTPVKEGFITSVGANAATNSVSNIEIAGFDIDGNRDNTTENICGIMLANGSNIKIHDNVIHDFYSRCLELQPYYVTGSVDNVDIYKNEFYGNVTRATGSLIYTYGAGYSNWQNNYFHDCNKQAIYANQANRISVVDSVFSNVNVPLDVRELVVESHFTDNTVYNTPSGGWGYRAYPAQETGYHTASFNRFDCSNGGSAAAVIILYGQNISFDSNLVVGSAENNSGILVYGAVAGVTNIKITNNMVKNILGTVQGGITVNAPYEPSSNVLIHGNTVIGLNGGRGIYLSGTATDSVTNCVVSNNRIIPTAADFTIGIAEAAAGTDFNLIVDNWNYGTTLVVNGANTKSYNNWNNTTWTP